MRWTRLDPHPTKPTAGGLPQPKTRLLLQEKSRVFPCQPRSGAKQIANLLYTSTTIDN
jgi:hypothetical protein